MTPRERAKKIVADWDADDFADRPELIEAITTAIQAASNEQLERCRAVDRQADVSAFHRKFGVPHPERPGWPSQERIDLRAKLIAEEFCELLEACGYGYNINIDADVAQRTVFRKEKDGEPRDFTKAADALIDLEYVILGTHTEFGIDSNPLWAEVQAANMRKEGGSTREDGKILKPAGWKGPDIEGALRKQGWRDAEALDEIERLKAEIERLAHEAGGR